MWRFQLKPDVIGYKAAISACEKVQRWEQAINLSEDMWRSLFEPLVVGFNAAISACERPAMGAGHKLAAGNVALPVESRSIGFNAAISAC